MCGITGIVTASHGELPLRAVVERMTAALRHRGPDDEGFFVSDCVALGHRRLSIQDLSPAGRQPMASADGRWQMVFNGEVYNFLELRRELVASGHAFRGGSDTEVMLASIVEHGLAGAIERWNGMFAIGLWDTRQRQLHLIRDRIGIKPLYCLIQPQAIAFASELKALLPVPAFDAQLDRRAIGQLLRVGYSHGERTIYRDVRRVQPGEHLTFAFDERGAPRGSPDSRRYWSVPASPLIGSGQQAAAESVDQIAVNVSDAERDERLLSLLKDSVRQRLIADVPVGSFLSGGLDSALVTSIASEVAGSQLTAITIGFGESEFDESAVAAEIAARLGVTHVRHQARPEDALELIQDLPSVYDEPFADSSQLPTLLLCRLARQHVTVCLSGDGGDELFGGYERYRHINGIRRRLAKLPAPLKSLLSWGPVSSIVSRLRGRGAGQKGLIQSLLPIRDSAVAYELLNSHWRESLLLDRDGDEQTGQTELAERVEPGLPMNCDERDFIHQMMRQDANCYLPEDILTKVDRASMSCGLEVRVPLLDHRLVEDAFAGPASWKFNASQGKLPLRRCLASRVPPSVLDRPKQGFGVPIVHWLRGPLRDWAEDLLSVDRLRRDGILRPEPIRQKWHEHVSGQAEWHYLLWDVLMLQSWLAARKEGC
ncbi:MAG: asparagine synthase (glutamine-hydrolyzing) [Planctomycetales bacterium]|nr:asparagine synthase (glutamine-hydrolyzing) [Planctomycetales bacterium]